MADTAFMYVDTSEGSRTGYLGECGETQQLFDDRQQRHTQEYVRGGFS